MLKVIIMSDISPSLKDIDILINGGIPSNKRNYVQEQAVSGDQVLYELAIRNRVLVDWSRIEIDLLNGIIPGGAVKINPASERMQERLKWHCWQAQQQYKKLNQKRSKVQRNTFLHKWRTISILASDVVTASDFETKITEAEEKILDQQRRISFFFFIEKK